MTPKVSICIPVYNVERYIGECLKSLIKQTYANIEIIIVNDCTPDHSMNIVKEYAVRDSRIRIMEHSQNKGLMRARQTGYFAATGDYIMFCDSDDILPLNSVEKLINAAIKNDGDIISGDMQRFTNNQFFAQSHYSLPYGSDSVSVYKALLSKNYFHNLCSKLFRKSLLKDYKYITLDNATNGEDAILFYQIVEHSNKVIHIPEVVYYYRFNPTSSTQCRYTLSGINSILFMQTIRQEIGMKYPELYGVSWIFISKIINNLFASGYGREYDLNKMIKEYHLTEYIDLKQMYHHLPMKLFFKLILLRALKLNYWLHR